MTNVLTFHLFLAPLKFICFRYFFFHFCGWVISIIGLTNESLTCRTLSTKIIICSALSEDAYLIDIPSLKYALFCSVILMRIRSFGSSHGSNLYSNYFSKNSSFLSLSLLHIVDFSHFLMAYHHWKLNWLCIDNDFNLYFFHT